MVRFLGLLIAFILIVPLIRMVFGVLGRLFTDFAMKKSGAGGGSRVGGGAPMPAQVGGTLHKDPVCGTFVSEAVAKTHVSHGQRQFFCSEECLKKYLQQS